MNKGIKLATGEIIGILNSDDIYFNNNILQQVVDAFKNEKVDACYGDLVYVDQNNTDKVIRFWKSGEFRNGAFLKGWMPPHPTFFCRSSVYRQFGLFNLNYKLAADVELLFRFLEKFQIKAKYLPITLTKMRVGGATNRNLRNIKQQNEEVLTFLDIFYGRRVGRLNFLINKFIDRLNQYFSRNMN
jgi:glycosyltransferase involved in cell wall biosynthesis